MKRVVVYALIVCITLSLLPTTFLADARRCAYEKNVKNTYRSENKPIDVVFQMKNLYDTKTLEWPSTTILDNYSNVRDYKEQITLSASPVNATLDSSILGNEQALLNEYESALSGLMSGEAPNLSQGSIESVIESVLDDLSRIGSTTESSSNTHKPGSTNVPPSSNPVTSLEAYLIHISSSANGTIQTSYSRAVKGTSVSITLFPNDGYRSKNVYVEGTNLAGSVKVSGSGNDYSFIMPGKQVTVSASFEPIQQRVGGQSAQSIGNGYVSQLEDSQNSGSCAPNSNKTPSATYVMRPIIVNNHPAVCDTWMIEGSSFFKIRDIAYLFSDTNLKFNPAIDGSQLYLQFGVPYSAQGDEMKAGEGDSTDKTQPMGVILNSVQQSGIKAFMIDRECCVRLSDLGNFLGFDVDYNSDTNTIIISFQEPQNVRQFPFYSKHYGVPSFQFVMGVVPYSENDAIHAYSFSSLRNAGHAHDCVASYAKVLHSYGFVHTKKLSDREGHPVALFESKTKNRLVLVGSTSLAGCSVIVIVVGRTDNAKTPLDQYETAVLQL